MIHICNVCQMKKLYFQTHDYCPDCKAFICSECLKTWDEENNTCPICHKVTCEDIEQTIYNSEEELEESEVARNHNCIECNCNLVFNCFRRQEIYPENYEGTQPSKWKEMFLFYLKLFSVIFILGFITDVIIYNAQINELKTHEEKEQFKQSFINIHKEPLYYLLYPLYSFCLFMILIKSYILIRLYTILETLTLSTT
jgi:hypothetical protein